MGGISLEGDNLQCFESCFEKKNSTFRMKIHSKKLKFVMNILKNCIKNFTHVAAVKLILYGFIKKTGETTSC